MSACPRIAPARQAKQIERACLHRLQRGDLAFTQGTLRLETTFGGEVEHLPSHHAAETGCARQFCNERNSYRWIGMHVRSCHDVERQRKKCVADEDCRCLVEGFVYRRSPAPQIVIVHCRQIVVNQRIAMHELERGAGCQCARTCGSEHSGSLDKQERSQAFAAIQRRVAHGGDKPRRAENFPVERCVVE